MRIEELVLEGFKSYPVRTQITGWDSSFNAITGLNGSGKSNILDAICFVLGMTNVSQMRAQNQQDLIYKRGQAGITKASVTVVFDNSDRATSPVGLENLKQITVTRQIALPNISKYLLNGHKATQQQIQTLFQSVQLNINNPNFLIMQGKITKASVLNMRPQEILGMVEEAAGTRMFEERKDKAKKTMGKKEKRVDEITALLAEEIVPKLDALRAEKRSFLQYQKTASELERIGRLLRAWEWAEAKRRIDVKQGEVEKRERDIGKVKKEKERFGKEGEAAEKAAEGVRARREEEMRKGGRFKKREEELAELEKVLVKIRTQVDIKNTSLADEEKKVIDLQRQVDECENSATAKQTELKELTAAFETVKAQYTETQVTLTNAEELLQTLLTGLSGSNAGSGGGGYMGQLADAQGRLAHATAEEEQGRNKLSMSEKELKELQAKWKAVEKEAGDGKKNLDSMRVEVDKLKKKVEGSGWSEGKERAGEHALREAKSAVQHLSQQLEVSRSRLTKLDFDYDLPYPNFDRSKVKGLVANLISLDEKDYPASTALEITAGARLYNVVVEDEMVGKDLLQRGKLKKRVTIIPLNKINAFKMSSQKLQAAERIAPGKARLALSLIGYEDEVANAMAYVFGDTLICADAESAKAVTFSREVGVKSVTLDGDVYDPSGTLSGGSAPSSNGTLVKVQEVNELAKNLAAVQKKCRVLEEEESRGRGARTKWKALVDELELKEHQVKLLEEQIGGSNAARIGQEVEAMQKKIDDLTTAVQMAKDKQKAAKEECKQLEKDMAEFKNNKEGKINELKANISKQKASVQKQNVAVKTQQRELQTATLEEEQLQSDITTAKNELEEARLGVEKLTKELQKLAEQLAANEAAHAEAEAKLREERATLTRFDNELKELEKVVKEKKHAINEAELTLKRLEHDLVTLQKEKTTEANRVANLEKQHPWILEEKGSFGKAGSPFDFAATDMGALRETCRELEEQQKGMKKKINPKVINMLDSVEKREVSLKKMLATVLKDKEKIEDTIVELDRYKRDALQKTWEKVTQDFGEIFAELLPGNFAKLQPPEGQDLTQGLEVKVRLGTVWKQSLTELSGGQRSLIALSLIMSLLQFKPAPMYILDEIDAALDLSHTQHIGQLFRTRFKGSQFIVVSLKEGLFTNANVLFRARFRDGTSIVERTAQRSGSTLYTIDGSESADKENGRRRGK